MFHRLLLASTIALLPGLITPGCDSSGDGTNQTTTDPDGFVARKLRVLSIEPGEGFRSGGQLVAMTGTGFQPDMQVTFGGVDALQVVVGADELAVMRAPSANVAGPVDVTLTLKDGRSTTVKQGYTYVRDPDDANTQLLLVGVTPSRGDLRGGTLVVIEGRGFIDGAQVFFGAAPASDVRVVGPNAITVTAPAGFAEGPVDLRVTTPENADRDTMSASLAAAFTYVADITGPSDELRVLGVIPGEGPRAGGNLATIRGQAFKPGASVFFGALPAIDVQVLGDAAIVCRVPAGLTVDAVDVRVELEADGGQPGQAHALADAYRYLDDADPMQVLRTIPGHGPRSGGNVVTVEGRSFIDGAQVFFGGAAATQVQVLAPTAITCRAPEGVATGFVNVRVELPNVGALPGETHTAIGAYQYTEDGSSDEELLVLGAVPASGPRSGGNLVTVQGQGFAAGAEVYFGGIQATEILVLGDTTINCRAPAGLAPGLVNLRVELPSGQSDTLGGGYTYVDDTDTGSLLVLSAIPAEGPLAGGNLVTLAGQGFELGAQVWFGPNQSGQVQVLGPTAISVGAPEGGAAGLVDIRVQNPGGFGTAHTLVNGYTYRDDAVTADTLLVLGVIPSQGPVSGGNLITIAGQGFESGARLYFGGAEAAAVNVIGPNAITALAPAGVSPGFINVRVELLEGAGAHSLPNAYEYVDDGPAPDALAVLGVVPLQGPLAGGNIVTVAGQGFEPGAQVYFGGVPAAQIDVLGTTALTCVAPAGVAEGLADVRVELLDGPAHTLHDAYRYIATNVPDTLVVFGVTPAAGPQSGGNVLVIAGQGFVPGAAVYVGGAPATGIQVLGGGAITCRAPAGANLGTTSVRVELPSSDGVAGAAYTLPDAYEYLVSPGSQDLSIVGVTPATGPKSGGNVVAISGSGFVPGMQVYFAGAPASQIQVLGSTAITCNAPAAASAGLVNVRVERPLGGAAVTLPAGYEYVEDGPPVQALLVLSTTPPTGPLAGGNLVTIAGQGFTAGATVWFGGVAAEQVQVLAPTALTCVAPAGVSAGPVNVRVELGGGTGAAHTLFNGYTYAPGAPTEVLVLDVLPNAGPLSGGSHVIVSGQAFAPGAKVYFGGKPATGVTVLASTAISCVCPDGASLGATSVRVELPGSGGAHTLDHAFTYLDDGSTDTLLVTDVVPSTGPRSGGNPVTVVGRGFEDGAAVYFGGPAATDVNVLAPTVLTCVAPQGFSTDPVDVRVQNTGSNGETHALANAYRYLDDGSGDALRVLGITPADGPIGGGDVVAIEGAGFLAGARVYFGGVPATQVQVLGGAAITCRAPAGVAAGHVNVRVENPGADGAAYTLFDAYEYLPSGDAALTIATVYPVQGEVGGGQLVLLTGTGFHPAMQVRFGGEAAPLVQVLGPSSATALTPAHVAGLVDVIAVAPDATQFTLPSAYVYVDDLAVDPNAAPAIGALLPASGPATGGTLVRLVGANFDPEMTITIGDTEVSQVAVHSTALATFLAPAGALGPASVTVENPNGLKDALSSGFTYTPTPEDPPSITGVWPAAGPTTGGTWIAVDGAHFSDRTIVSFGLVPANETIWVSETRLVAVAPPGTVGTVDLHVTRPDGAFAMRPGGFAYYDPAALPDQPPVIGNVFPSVGPRDGGQVVSLLGSGFRPGARIYFGAAEATVVAAPNSAQRVVETPAHSIGAVSVTLVNPDGLTHTLANAFVYVAAAPLIKAVAPATGGASGGYPVTIRGKNLGPETTVTFGPIAINSFIAATADDLTFIAPPGVPGPIDVGVSHPDGQTDSESAAFTYLDGDALDQPLVTAVEPVAGPSTGGYIALITGQQFAESAEVYFGSTAAGGVVRITDTLIKCLVPPGPADAIVDVTVRNSPFATHTLPAAFTYQAQFVSPLRVSAVTPGTGSTAGGTVVTIEGDGFTAGTGVRFGNTPAVTVNVVSFTTLTAVTPPGPDGLVSVRVDRPDQQTVTAFNAFGYIDPSRLDDAPRIDAVDPALGPLTGNSIVLMTGERFAPGAQVFFGAEAAPVAEVLDGGRIVVRTPGRLEAGTVAVAVINPDGLVAVLPGGYTYYDASGATPPDVFVMQPAIGSSFGGETVDVLGDALAQGARAYVCGKPAVTVELSGDSQLSVRTPAGAPGLCPVAVVNPDGLVGERLDAFEYVAPAPIVSSVIPSTGPVGGGIDIVVQGDNFVAGATVRFGLSTAPNVTVANRSTLTARLPPGVVGTVDVIVINPGTAQQSGALPDGFNYVESVSGIPPEIDSVLPIAGPLQGGTPVRVLGNNFDLGAIVIFDGQILPGAQILDDAEIRFVTPARSTPGTVPITILNPDGLGVTVAAAFTYSPPATPPPAITAVVPASGPEAGGNTVTITGANFRADGSWSMGGVQMANVATITESLITAQAPASTPGFADIVYVGPDGQVATRIDGYQYLAAPRLDGVVPELGGVAGLTEVTLIGDFMVPGMQVFFGGIAGEVLSVGSATTATARTPSTMAGGFVDVLVRNPDGQEGLLPQGYEYLDPPVIATIWPPEGPVSGGSLVQIRGAGLHRLSRVTFGGIEAARVVYESNGLLMAFTPPGAAAGAVDVAVLNPDGESTTEAGGFSYTALADLADAPQIIDIFPTAGPTSGGTRVGMDAKFIDRFGRAVFLPSPAVVDFANTDRVIAIAPAHALGPAEVYWVNPDGQTARADSDFTYLDPASVGPLPQITSVNPDRGRTAGGDNVTVIGLRFQSNARVRFGPNDATYVSGTATAQSVKTPPRGRGSVPVWVVNPDGSQAQAPQTFLYMAPPTITGVSPPTGPASGGRVVTITGSEFLEDPDGQLPTVLFCDDFVASSACVSAAAADVSASLNGRTLTVTTPAHSPSLTDVAVVAPDGQSAHSAAAFRFTPLPQVTDVDPSTGPTTGAATLTLTGTGFQTGAKIFLDGAECVDAVVSGALMISCSTPPGTTGPADLLVINPDGGRFEQLGAYTYQPPPIISDATPRITTEELAATGTIQITITGVNFSPSARVLFDAAEATIVSANFNQIVAVVPALQGSVDVIVRNPDGQEARLVDGFAYIPAQPPPTVLYLTPRVGLTFGAEPFVIVGANFQPDALVEFGNAPDWIEAANVSVAADGGTIGGLTPLHAAGVVRVRITNPDAQSVVIEDGYEFILPPEEQTLGIVNVDPSRAMVAGGAWVTVAGTGFSTDISLKFSQGDTTVPALELQRFGPTLMRAKVPPAPEGAGPATLIVTNPPTAENPQALTVQVDDFFEYLLGPVFERHPGDRLPIEGDRNGSDGALVFDATNDGLNDVLVYKHDGYDKLLVNGHSGRAGWFSRRIFYESEDVSNHRTRQAVNIDIDADGDQDVFRVIRESSRDDIELCENDGAGVFTCTRIYQPPNYCYTREIQVADLNCDGKEDIYIPMEWHTSYPCTNKIMLNSGDGSWTVTDQPLPSDVEQTRDAAIADVDGDGDNDILMVNNADTKTRVYLNNCADLQLAHPGGCTFPIPDFASASFEGKAYSLSNYRTSWHAARNKCNEFGMDLVSINTNEEDEFVRYSSEFQGNHMWIGLRDTDSDNRDEWVDGTGELPTQPYANVTDADAPDYTLHRYCSLSGSGVDYNPVPDPSEPNNTGSFQCVVYNWDSDASTGHRRSCWDDIYCNHGSYYYHFLCEASGVKPQCSNQWQFINVQYNSTLPEHGGDGRAALLFDINDDGLVDAWTGFADRSARVFMNTGSATAGGELFIDDSVSRWPPSAGTVFIDRANAVDIDGDGDLDIVAHTWVSSNWGVRVYVNDRYVTSSIQPGCDYENPANDCSCNPRTEGCDEVTVNGVGIFSDLTTQRWGPDGEERDVRTNMSSWTQPMGIGDLDGDDLPDLYLTGWTYSDRMVMNDGFAEGGPWTDENRVGPGHFRFNTYRALPELQHGTDGVTFADITGDGRPDILLCGDHQPLTLFIDTGQGDFVNQTAQRLPGEYRYRCRSDSIGVADIDGDGALNGNPLNDDNDIIFEGTEYSSSCQSGVACWGYKQLVNDGTGHFHDVTDPNYTAGHHSRGGEGVYFMDLDDDGDLDWLAAYDYSSHDTQVYINAGDTFNLGGAYSLLRTSTWFPSEIGRDNIRDITVIDVNGDRFPDVFVGTTGVNRAWLNVDGEYFVNAQSDTVPPGPFISSGGTVTQDLLPVDIDNDGDLDIIDLINGRNRLLARIGSDGFVDVTNDTLPTTSRNSQGGASGDLDNDGFKDVVIANWDQQNELLLNLGGTGFADISANMPWDRQRSRTPFLTDFDGDGDLDIYWPVNSDQHRIYINTVVSQ